MTRVIVTCLGAALLSMWVGGIVLKRAHRWSLLDVPNPRSLHVQPTPRGGGLGIVVGVVGATVVAWASGTLLPWYAGALLVGTLLVATVGWVDDRFGLTQSRRVIAHSLAAAIVLVALGGLPEMRVGGLTVQFGGAGTVLSVLGVAWGANLYNFMDGIDGLAGTQGLTAGGAAGVLLWVSGQHGLALIALAAAASCGGFLRWNWPPAKLFMGDVGSATLGYVFAVLAMASERGSGPPLVCWLLLFGVFIFDATATLFIRTLRGERVVEAHRVHAYQRIVLAGRSQRWVVLWVVGLNAWLTALAVLAYVYPASVLGMVALAVLSLAVVFVWAQHLDQRGA